MKPQIFATKNIETLNGALITDGIKRCELFMEREDFPDITLIQHPPDGCDCKEVEKIVPEVVRTDEKGYKSVDILN